MTFDELRSKAEAALDDEDCVSLANNLKASNQVLELVDTFLVEALVKGLAEERLAKLLASAYCAGVKDGIINGTLKNIGGSRNS